MNNQTLRMKLNLYIVSVITSIILVGCGTTSNNFPQKSTSSYSSNSITSFNPEFTVYHSSESTSDLYFKINSKEILYSKQQGNSDFVSNVIVNYFLRNIETQKQVADSCSIRIVDINNEFASKNIIGKIPLKAKFGNNYILEIVVKDITKNNLYTSTITIDKTNHLQRQNFLISLYGIQAPLFSNNVTSIDTFSLQYNDLNTRTLFVKYFKREFPIALPPFSEEVQKPFDFKPDSIFQLKLSDNGNINFIFPKKGLYHIYADSSKKEGLTLFNFSNNFPEITKAEEMIAPLRYMTSKNEFDQMSVSLTKKVEVDHFWLSIGGSEQRSKELIRKFYTRVEDANRFFTSYQEGWKTDRGMIYIILGKPTVTYKNSNGETWIYGEESNMMSLTLSFNKVVNPFTSNDYMLERSAYYKNNWYIGVQAWREGKIY